MNSYNSATSAYAQSAGEINSSLASYRADVDNIKAVNKQLAQSAEQTVDLDALKGLGEELAVRGFKTLVGKYGGKLYDYKIPKLGKSIGDLDREGGDTITRAGRKLYNRARGYDPEGDVEASGEGIEMDTFSSTTSSGVNSRMTSAGGGQEESNMADPQGDEDIVNDTEVNPEAEMSFEDFMGQFDTPMTTTGDIDFVRSSNQLGMGQADMESRQLSNEANAEANEADLMGREDVDVGGDSITTSTSEGASAADIAEGGESDLASGARSALSDATGVESDALSSLAGGAEGAAEEGASQALAGTLEGVGTALDSTGVLAPLGLLFNAAGVVAEGAALYEAGKSVWDWFDDDILGNKPKPPTVAIPKPHPTLAQRGMLITPNLDTLDTQVSYGSF